MSHLGRIARDTLLIAKNSMIIKYRMKQILFGNFGVSLPNGFVANAVENLNTTPHVESMNKLLIKKIFQKFNTTIYLLN